MKPITVSVHAKPDLCEATALSLAAMIVAATTPMTPEREAISELLVCQDNGCPHPDECPQGCRAVAACREAIRMDRRAPKPTGSR